MSTLAVVNHGPLLACKCPECKTHGEFHLTEKLIPSNFIKKMMLIFDRKEWNLECQDCQHNHKVPTQEGVFIKQVMTETSKDTSPEKMETFQKKMEQVTFVGELFNQSLGWDCPKCKESVAYNFQACWNCSEPHPEYEGGNEPPKFIPPMGCC
ncbi:MAG: hypothetical protein NE334_04895 [Lentisphaeraceae bacterium]|nr:hypothetical protein [Lentisphaeraceae bacterium]